MAAPSTSLRGRTAGNRFRLSDFGQSTGDSEVTAVLAKAITRKLVGAPEIVTAVAERFSGGDRPELPAFQEGNHVDTREAPIATCQKGGSCG
jgi:hypothetical protein